MGATAVLAYQKACSMGAGVDLWVPHVGWAVTIGVGVCLN